MRLPLFMLLCVFVFLSLALATPSIDAQHAEFLSRRPMLTKWFDPENKETLIQVLFTDPDGLNDPRFPPNIFLHSARYTYPGTTPTPPQSVTFKFIPRDRYKGVVHFLIIADDTTIQEGDASLGAFPIQRVGSPETQQLEVAVPIDTFLQIAKASKVVFKMDTKSHKDSHKLSSYEKKCVVALAAQQ